MISVCIATFNGEKYIKEQILSIIPQLSKSDEIIISDDGSRDKTLEVIKDIESPIIKIFINNGEHGYTPNFENALKHSSGDYIFLCDQDDIWTSNKVANCMSYFKNYDFLIHDAVLVNYKDTVIAESFFQQRHSRPGLIQNIIRFSYLGCCMAFKRDILNIALPFPKNHKYCTHDNWLALVGMAFFKTIVINEKLIHYRRYNNNTSSGGLKNSTSLLFKIRYRIYLIFWLVRRFISKRTSNKINKTTTI